MLALELNQEVLSLVFFGISGNDLAGSLRSRCERSVYVCRGSFQTNLSQVYFDILSVPDLDVLLCKDSGHVHVSWLVQLFDSSQHARSLDADQFITVFQLSLYGDVFQVIIYAEFFNVCNLWEIQFLSNLRSNLSGISVDSLTTCENQVSRAVFFFPFLDGSFQSVGSSPCVRTAYGSVGNQDTFVSALCYTLKKKV